MHFLKCCVHVDKASWKATKTTFFAEISAKVCPLEQATELMFSCLSCLVCL